MIKNLVEKGCSVRAIRRSAKVPFYIPENILTKVEWVEGDVLDVLSLDDAMQDVDAVVHAAAIVSFSARTRRNMYQTNVEGTANVVNIALDRGVQKLIHVSSVAALGRTTAAETVSEEKKWENNKNNTHYAITKHHAEMHAWRGFSEGLDGVVVNPSTILGYGDWNQSSCAIFKNVYKEFPWYTKGINGFVGVEDVAEAVTRLLFSNIRHKKFIVNTENRSFQDLFNTIADGFHKKRPYREATRMMGELAWRWEKLKSSVSGRTPLLTRETARVAQSRTLFDNHALLKALPGFAYTPLDNVIKNACTAYCKALDNGVLSL
jgi:nucleoside-diphosphate-sugar epimerase